VSAEPPLRQKRLIAAVERRAARARDDGRPRSVAAHLGQIGVLGWQIVVPGLLGVALGRYLDGRFDAGIFWTAGLLVGGLALGCWSAWRWVARQ
jgi:ATP synthase protein I